MDGGWYDGWWWATHARARRWFATHAPDRLDDFVAAFEVLRVPGAFEPTVLPDVVTAARRAEMVDAIASLEPAQLEDHELDTFGRHTVHDLFPWFRDRARDVVEDVTGMALEPSYDFLSLYHASGQCEVHLDAPNAMWTLDVVLEQSRPWPLHVSRVVPWPGDTDGPTRVPDLDDEALGFRSLVLEPGEAVVFGGTNQWHGRRPMPDQDPPGFCHLVFFHFVPAGTTTLVDPSQWPTLFDAPGLAAALAPDAHPQ